MDVSGITAQQSMANIKLTMAMVKSAHQADQALADMITAAVDATRGQNLDIRV